MTFLQYRTVKHLMLHQKSEYASFFAQNMNWRQIFLADGGPLSLRHIWPQGGLFINKHIKLCVHCIFFIRAG